MCFVGKYVLSALMFMSTFNLYCQTLKINASDFNQIFCVKNDKLNYEFQIKIESNSIVQIVNIELCRDTCLSDTSIVRVLKRLILLKEKELNDHRKNIHVKGKVGFVSFSSHNPKIQKIQILAGDVTLYSIIGIDIINLLKIDDIYFREEKLKFLKIISDIKAIICSEI